MDLNIPKLGIKLSGADEYLDKLNEIIARQKEINALAHELASATLKLELNPLECALSKESGPTKAVHIL